MEQSDRCKPDSVPPCGGGNHLSVRPEPGVYNAASHDSLPIWSCCGRSLPCSGTLITARWALTPPFHPYRQFPAGGLLSVALVLPQNMVCGTPLFKGAPCSVQSGLSSIRENFPYRDCPRLKYSKYNINTFLSLCKKKKHFFAKVLF